MARGEDDRLVERLGYEFSERKLLERALTHSSAVPELRAARGEEISFTGSEVQDNERLEFLGDAVLELLTSEHLVTNFPEWWEEGKRRPADGRSRRCWRMRLKRWSRQCIWMADWRRCGNC